MAGVPVHIVVNEGNYGASFHLRTRFFFFFGFTQTQQIRCLLDLDYTPHLENERALSKN